MTGVSAHRTDVVTCIAMHACSNSLTKLGLQCSALLVCTSCMTYAATILAEACIMHIGMIPMHCYSYALHTGIKQVGACTRIVYLIQHRVVLGVQCTVVFTCIALHASSSIMNDLNQKPAFPCNAVFTCTMMHA